MKWEVTLAKNGEYTLSLNSIFIYSKYRPIDDVEKWVVHEYDAIYENYLLIGLGLGYHLRVLAELEKQKPIYAYFFEQQEYELFLQYNGTEDWYKASNIHILHDVKELNITVNTQILIPHVWLKALNQQHPLLGYLEDIKINQMTYNKSAELMEYNFNKNRLLEDFDKYPSFHKKSACLVASGPSLNKTVHWLKKGREKLVIFSVGSALKGLLANDIVPDAVIISDPKPNITVQFQDVKYSGPLFYLSTANHQAVAGYPFARYMLCQLGYPLAEKLAVDKGMPLLETGGSVSTIAFSLLEHLQFEQVFLFGLDLGFSNQKTHTDLSTSGRMVRNDMLVREIVANDGTVIQTTPNLQTYLRWFNERMKHTQLNIYNTSQKGAAIGNVPYIHEDKFHDMIHKKKN